VSITGSTFDHVRALVRREAGIVLEPGKEYLVEARLLPLCREAGVADVDAYVADLQRAPHRAKIDKVVDALTTNETSWMRDSEPFQALVSDVLPAIMASPKLTRTVNIWSAACSSGQEPYGIAMMISDLLRTSGWRAEILASDISLQMLQRAQAGVYSQLEINRGLPATLLVKHFARAGASWKISDELRRSVTFKQVNLALAFPPLPTFDVIFLRNVLIYFDTPTKRAILQRMHQVLSPGGFLFLGGAETTLGIDEEWERVKVGRAFAHRPKDGPSRPPTPAAARPAATGLAGSHFGGAGVQ
jgi:chemotaxis protein methyltransferase CheR